MRHPFIPDRLYPTVYDISPNALSEFGIQGVVLDIDNTLVTYGMAEPTEDVLLWIEHLRSAGIQIAIASNNKKERVDLFNRRIGAFAVCRSKKPSPRAILAAAEAFGISPSRIAVIGDQIFTDVLAARRANAIAILVKPLPYAENLFFKCKRLLEKPFIRAYYCKANRKNKGGSHGF